MDHQLHAAGLVEETLQHDLALRADARSAGKALAEDLADRRAGDVARSFTNREKAAVKRDAGREGRLTKVTSNLRFVDIIEKVQLGFLF